MIDARDRAKAYMLACDGAEAVAEISESESLCLFARKGRALARETIRLACELDAERSARVAIQESAQRWEAIARKWEQAAREAA